MIEKQCVELIGHTRRFVGVLQPTQSKHFNGGLYGGKVENSSVVEDFGIYDLLVVGILETLSGD